MFAGGYSAYSHDAREVFKNGVREVQFDSFPNYNLLHYMQTRQVERIMEENRVTILAVSEEVIVRGVKTVENFYGFLSHQMDESKRTIETVIRYSGPIKGFIKNHLSTEIDTEEQWKLDAATFIYLKSLLLTATQAT